MKIWMWFLFLLIPVIMGGVVLYVIPWNDTGIFGIPSWLPAFILVEIIYCMFFFVFVKYGWKEE